MYCRFCGRIITDDSRYCQYCGKIQSVSSRDENKLLKRLSKRLCTSPKKILVMICAFWILMLTCIVIVLLCDTDEVKPAFMLLPVQALIEWLIVKSSINRKSSIVFSSIIASDICIFLPISGMYWDEEEIVAISIIVVNIIPTLIFVADKIKDGVNGAEINNGDDNSQIDKPKVTFLR